LIEKQSVPFLQMVLHGYVSYCGTSLNLSDDLDTEFLKAIEYGSGICYCLNNAEPELLKNTNYSELYSTQYSHWEKDAVAHYALANEALAGTVGAVITNHLSTQKDLYVTYYDNGTVIAVNYGKTPVSFQGITVEARNFAVVSQ
jgi:hypothetical protein